MGVLMPQRTTLVGSGHAATGPVSSTVVCAIVLSVPNSQRGSPVPRDAGMGFGRYAPGHHTIVLKTSG